MVVTMAGVRMVQVPVDEVVEVIAVRHNLVTAGRAVCVGRVVTAARVRGGAGVWIGAADLDDVFVDVRLVGVMQVPVVQVVDMVAVAYGGVATGRAVDVSMEIVRAVFGHDEDDSREWAAVSRG